VSARTTGTVADFSVSVVAAWIRSLVPGE